MPKAQPFGRTFLSTVFCCHLSEATSSFLYDLGVLWLTSIETDTRPRVVQRSFRASPGLGMGERASVRGLPGCSLSRARGKLLKGPRQDRSDI